jgi:hypothetical protein
MKKFPIIALLAGLSLAFIFSSKPKATGKASFPIVFNPYPPKDLSPTATPEELLGFAWSEFFSLNWRSSFSTDKLRDNPDLTWSYEKDPSPFPSLDVWETYAHRTELRPFSNVMLPFDNPPHYSFGTMPPPGVAGSSFTLFDNLDENNEIGSCNVYARVSDYGKTYRVIYQAKVNRDEYDYLYKNYNTKQLLDSARKNNIHNITNDSAYYKGAPGSCNCPKDSFTLCLPCGGAQIPNAPSGQTYTGAIEVKSAWRVLTPKDDASRFFTRTVIVYEKINNVVVYFNRTYALIGLHIIHKTANYPAFVFATFEHIDVENNDMGYVLLDTADHEIGPLHAHFPRLHPIPAAADASTDYAHQLLAAKNPNSIWKYYRIVGVQAVPTNNTAAFSFFMANYVVESDSTLANFRGSGIGTPFNGLPNTLYNGHGVSMGGCQGCHGVAQTQLGGDFSFLMDDVGKPVQTPDVGLTMGKLQRLLKALEQSKPQQKKLRRI